MTSCPPVLAIGLMSGTSADGIDAAVLRTDGENVIEPLGGTTVPYQRGFRKRLMALASKEQLSLVDVMDVERQLTPLHIAAVHRVVQERGIVLSDVEIVGLHGHTVRHLPHEGFTWQLGDGQALADGLGRPVVFDFRKADMAAGGQGAPLAPLYHRALLRGRKGARLILNLGGVANITWIGSCGEKIVAGDTGPGCGLLDAWMQRHTGETLDRDGVVARSGSVDKALVEQALVTLPYFHRPLPKSADRYEFDQIHAMLDGLSVADGAATLCAITVEAVVQTVDRLEVPPQQSWVTGGGRHHPLMMQMLTERLAKVQPISALGHEEDLLEAECFAWLAVRRLRGWPTSLPETTGASQATCGGTKVVPVH